MVDSNPYELPPIPQHPDNLSPEEIEFTPTNDERNLSLIAHLSGAAGILMGGLVGFIGPLVIYLLKKDSSVYIESQAKEALNFQITLLLLAVICVALTVVTCGTLFPLLFVPTVLQIVFAIIAGLSVRDGKHYRYPFNIRLLK